MKTSLRILGWTAGIFVLLLFFFILSLPTLLSTSWGLRQALAEINSRFEGVFIVDDASLSWFGSQRIKGISVKESNGKTILSISDVELSQGMASLFFHGFNLSPASLSDLNADIGIDTKGSSNLLSALQKKGASKKTFSHEHLLKSLQIIEANAAIVSSDLEGTIAIKAKGKTKDGAVEGDFLLQAILEKEKKLTLDDLTLKMRVNNFPVDLIEQLVAIEYPQFKGIILAALGDTLNVSIDENQKDENSASKWEIISPHLKANFHASMDTNRFTLLSPAKGEIIITPELFSLLVHESPKDSLFFLKSPTQLNLNIETFDIPLGASESMQAVKMRAEFALGEGRIGSAFFVKDIFISDLKGEINAPEGVSKALLQVKGFAGQKEAKDAIVLNAHASIPLAGANFSWKDLYDKEAFEFKGELAAKNSLLMKNPFDGSALAIESFNATVEGTSLKDLTSALAIKVGFPNEKEKFSRLFRKSAQIHLSSLAALNPNGGVKLEDVHAKIQSDSLNVEMRGEISKNKVTLLSPALLQITVQPEDFSDYIAMADYSRQHQPTMVAPSMIAMTIAPVTTSFTKEGLQNLSISGHFQMNSLSINVKGETFAVEELVIPWEIDGEENKIKISFSGKTRLETSDNPKEGTFRGKVTAKNWGNNDRPLQTKIETTLVDFPSELLALATDHPELGTLLGPTISAEIEGVMPIQDGVGQVELSLHSERLYLEASVDIKDRIVLADPNKPVKIEVEITPERYKSIIALVAPESQQSKLVLEGVAKALVAIDTLDIPLNNQKEGGIIYWKSGLRGRVNIDELSFVDKKTKVNPMLNSLNATFNSQNIQELVQITLNALVKGDKGVNGQLSSEVTIENLFQDDGQLNTETLSLNANLKANDFHVNLMSRLLSPYPTMPEKLEAILGDPVSGQVDIKLRRMNGSVKAAFAGTNGRFNLQGDIFNGVLTLLEPFTVEVMATPLLGKNVLSEIAPFLEGLNSADERIKIYIDSNGFRFPLKNFNLTQLTIPKAKIETGKMQLSSEGNMRTIVGLLGKDKHDTLNAWLTPIYFSLQNGLLKLERVDMLLNHSFPLAAWGTVDFNKDKVNMVIGIRGMALSNAFNIPDLSPNYMLQLPLKGSTSSPGIDKRKATARISALVAQTQGPQGLLVGTVLEVASGSLTEDSVPAPTTSPLPWEGMEVKPVKSAQQNKAPSVKDEVRKGATSLLKGLMK